MNDGFTMTAAQFCSLTSTTENPKINLYSLIPTGVEYSSEFFIQFLDDGGKALNTYMWNPNFDNGDGTKGAWTNLGGSTKIDDFDIPAGTSLWIQGYPEHGLRSSGKLLRDPVMVPLNDGFTATGNPFPVAINIQGIVPSGVEYSSELFMQTLDDGGNATATYMYNPNFDNDDGTKGAWTNLGGSTKMDIDFPAGQGLWIQGYPEFSITFDIPKGM